MEIISDHINTSDMTRIRVRKGHEDETFLGFFPNGFVILDEARPQGGIGEFNAKMAEKGAMFRIQAPFGGGARAIEQNERSSQYLNSGDSALVITPGFANAYIWDGIGSNEPEQKAGPIFANCFTTKPQATTTVKETEEDDAFWESIGGKGEYSTSKESL